MSKVGGIADSPERVIVSADEQISPWLGLGGLCIAAIAVALLSTACAFADKLLLATHNRGERLAG